MELFFFFFSSCALGAGVQNIAVVVCFHNTMKCFPRLDLVKTMLSESYWWFVFGSFIRSFFYLLAKIGLDFWIAQAWECTAGKELAWNVLSLFTTSGMLFLEVSLLAFLFQGNHVNGLEAMTRTFGVSGLVVGLDIILKVSILVSHISSFLSGVCLFVIKKCLHFIGFLLPVVIGICTLISVNSDTILVSRAGNISVWIWDPVIHWQQWPSAS